MEDDSSGAGDGLNPDEVKSVSPSLGPSTWSAMTPATWPRSRSCNLWNGTATALAGSQEFVNMDGIEYDQVIAKLNANPAMTADQVAVATAASATSR